MTLLYMCTMKELRMSQNATAFVTSINLWCLVKVIPTIKADRQREKNSINNNITDQCFTKGYITNKLKRLNTKHD